MSNLYVVTSTSDKGQIPTMLTIKQVSESTNLSYNHIRKLCINDEIVYIRTGKKYLINFEKFIDYLNTGKK